MEIEGSHEIREKEWSRFLAACWQKSEAPSDEAWKTHLRRAAFVSLRHAHKLLSHAATDDYEEDLIEAEEAASDEIIAVVNAHMRIWPCPHLPAETWDAYLRADGSPGDEDFNAVFNARLKDLQTMPYANYLATPEWADVRRGALRRARYGCQTCGRGRALHVHHRTYERRGREKPDDLIVLCEGCHLAVHTHGGSRRPAVQ